LSVGYKLSLEPLNAMAPLLMKAFLLTARWAGET
jgi:hypothetical protein